MSLITIALIVCPTVLAGQLYKWVDNQGNLHFSDSPASIPPEYSDQVEVNEFGRSDEDTKISGEEKPPPKESVKLPSVPRMQRTRVRSEVHYAAYEGEARRVIVSVKLNGNVTANMAIDTGAPSTVITPQLAERMGLFSSDGGFLITRAGGIGGSAPAIWTIIDDIQIGDMKARFFPTTITELKTSAFEGLIGMDFLYAFNFNIDPRRKVLVLEELPVQSDMPGGHDEAWWRSQFRQFALFRGQWKKYNKYLNRLGPHSEEFRNYTDNEVRYARDFAAYQSREADKLFRKLNSYATDHAVPMHWREY